MPTQKELDKIGNSQSSLKEILKVHITEPFTQSDLKFIETHFTRLDKKDCIITYDEKVSKGLAKNDNNDLLKMMEEGHLIFELPQLKIRLLYVKVFGGKGLFGKKIHYAIYLQEFDEKKWTPISTQKTLTIGITSIGNFFRQAGLLKGVGI